MSAIAMALITILAWGTISDENVLIRAIKREVAADTPVTHIGDSEHGAVTLLFVQMAVESRQHGVVLWIFQIPRPGGGAGLV